MWRRPNCGEQNEDQFDLCWRCVKAGPVEGEQPARQRESWWLFRYWRRGWAILLLAVLAAVLGVWPEQTRADVAVEAWVQRYSIMSSNSIDHANRIVTDSAGNVIVAGYSDEGITGQDMLIIKYSNGGEPLWTNRYSGPGNSDDVAVALQADVSGNVYVTGYSFGSGSQNDYATIAYSSAGVPLWTNLYNGPGNSTDQANAVAVDTSGNVYVTGYSFGSGDSYDYATIAYSSAGVPLWTNLYNGPGNSTDQANAVAVGASGEVYVTGASYGSGSGVDYATVAYSNAGLPVWTNRYSGPGSRTDSPSSVAVAVGGDVVVTGSSTGTNGYPDYATVAYSSAGVPLWTNRYNGPADRLDRACCVATGSSGNVYVTGYSASTNTYPYPYAHDYATVAYSSTGVPLWTNRYNGPANSYDQAYGAAVDAGGNVVVTGNSVGNGSGADYATIKYSSGGEALWTNRYNGLANSADSASAVVVDTGGNVFLAGYSTGSGGDRDCVAIAYSSAGVPWWTNTYNGLRKGEALATAVAVDAGGKVVVTGYSTGNGTAGDYTTIKYSSGGLAWWTNRYNGPANSTDSASAVAVDTDGNAYVTGHSVGGGSGYDYATIAYSSAGVPLWTNRYNGPGNGDDSGSAIAVDSNGNVIVTGRTYSGSGSTDYATIAYSSAGVALWTNRFNGSANGDDYPESLAVGPGGAVYVAGVSDGNSSSGIAYDFATVKYVVPPVITDTVLAGNSLVFSGRGGGSGGVYCVLATTNVVEGMSNWERVATNTLGTGGSFSVTTALDPAKPRQFFRLQLE